MPSFTPPPGKSRRTIPSSASATAAWSVRCEQAVDLGIAASILAIPLMLGGIKPAAQLFLVVLSVLTASAWLLSQAVGAVPRWRWLGAEPLILAAAVLLVLQVTPLPQEWLDRISPRLERLLPLWSNAAGEHPLGTWRTVSLVPADGRSGMLTFGAYALLFLVTAQRIRTAADARRVLGWVAVAAAGQAVFGLVQFLFSNGKFFWVHVEPGISTANELHGSFVNRNHAAHFLALGIGPLLWFALGDSAGSSAPGRSFRSKPNGTSAPLARTAAWLGAAAVVLACALTMSRGGLLALGAAAAVFVLASHRGRFLSGGMLPILAMLGGAVAVALFLPGAERIEQRLASLTSLDINRMDQAQGRRRIWQAVADGIAEFPILGTGLGSHRYVYPLYFDHPDEQIEYNTADSGYLELTLETGLAGLLLAVMALALLIARALRAAAEGETAGHAAAAAAGIAASALHSVFETPWFMPGCMMLLIPLAACAVASGHGGGRDREAGGMAVPRPLFAMAALMLPCCLWSAVPVKQELIRNGLCRKALDPLTTDAHEFDPASLDPAEWREQLDAIARNAGGSPRIHLGLAGQYLQLFEQLQKSAPNPLTLPEIRETAVSGGFQSSAELQDWMSRAFGENAACLIAARAHARRAVELCPLEGRGYVYLSELAFLDLKSIPLQRQLVQQAARVRPFDPHVMFAAGQLEWQSGDPDGALAHWKQAYQRSRVWEATVTDALVNILPAEEFIATFQPDWTALRVLRHRLRGTSHPGYAVILRRLAEETVLQAQSETAERSADLWLEAGQEFEELQETELATDCALAAVAAHPGSYETHFRAGRMLLQSGRFQEAAEELRWCRQRRPDDRQVAEFLAQAMRSTISTGDSADATASTTASRGPVPDSAVEPAHDQLQEPSAGAAGWIQDRATVTQADFSGPPPRKD